MGVSLPVDHQSTKVAQPGEGTLDMLAVAVAGEVGLPSRLGRVFLLGRTQGALPPEDVPLVKLE